MKNKQNYIGAGRCTVCRSKTSVAHIYDKQGDDIMSVCSQCDQTWYERTADEEKERYIQGQSVRFFR